MQRKRVKMKDYSQEFEIAASHPVNNLSETEIAYIAGLIDGEGCIGITYRKESDSFESHFGIRMTDTIIIPWLSEKLDVSYRLSKRNHPIWKDIFYLRLSGKTGIAIVITILPFLKLKKRQAELFIELVYLQSFSKPRGLNKGETFTHDYARQKEIYNEMKALNRKGKLQNED